MLSVVLPVRDGEPYLADTLTSLIRNQSSEFDIEIVVVDDGSVDATPEIIDDFRGDLPGLVVVRNPASTGPAAARNTGLERASGRYVTFLDGDDWLAPGYLPRLVSTIEHLRCDVVRVDHVRVTGRRRELFRAPEPRRGVVLNPRDGIVPQDAKTMVDYPYAWAGIYRRDLGDLLTFPDALHTAEDRPWIWRLHRRARSYAVVSLAGVFYRRGLPGSLTQIGDERQLHVFDAYEIILAEVEPEFFGKAVRNLCALVASHAERAGRLTPELRARFAERAATALDRLPRAVLTETLAAMNPERLALLRPLLPGGPGA